jgi:hypothetical protein
VLWRLTYLLLVNSYVTLLSSEPYKDLVVVVSDGGAFVGVGNRSHTPFELPWFDGQQ